MRNDVQRAMAAVKKEDADFKTDSVWETTVDFVLISNEPCVPPYIVSKRTWAVRQVDFGNKEDMDIAYKRSKLVMKG